MLAFASPRFFNAAFRRAADALELTGKLHALRVNVRDDPVPHLPPRTIARALGMVAGTAAELVLQPWDSSTPLLYREEDEGYTILPSPSEQPSEQGESPRWRSLLSQAVPEMALNGGSHTCHALYLASETTPKRPHTVPLDVTWPLVSRGEDPVRVPDIVLDPDLVAIRPG
jgi:hypothetical protein